MLFAHQWPRTARIGGDPVARPGTRKACATFVLLVTVACFGCSSASSAGRIGSEAGLLTTTSRPTHVIAPTLVTRVADIPRTRPARDTFRIHLIDVGTGLSVLVQGHDFNFVYDGGSNDAGEGASMTRTDDETRLLSYLFAAIGPSGGCSPAGDEWGSVPAERLRIDHVVMSHPHADHGSMLDEVLGCYRVENLWDSGLPYDADFYWAYLDAVGVAPELAYHTVRPIPSGRELAVGNGAFSMPERVPWSTFAAGDHIELGSGARATVVHANSRSPGSEPNMASVVLRLELGATSMLLTGDIESGDRAHYGQDPGRAEAAMLEDASGLLDVDILQVAHHGSLTSSRMGFLRAVSPQVALIGSGPHPYSRRVLPDREVLDALESVGAIIYQTNVHDVGTQCVIEGVDDRVGRERGPGGCDNYIFEVR